MPSIRFTTADGAIIKKMPSRASKGASGVDLIAAIPNSIYLFPGQVVLVPTGVHVAIPFGYELQIRPRSGLALRNRIIWPNAPGTIDSDYRGEIKILVRNIGDSLFIIRPRDRIAQAVCARSLPIRWKARGKLPDSARDQGGFGSTGRQ